MKKILFLAFACVSMFGYAADKPVIKVDFNEPSRANMEEVLEPGYTAWPTRKDCYSDSLTVSGVKFVVSANGSMMRVGWNKAFVQLKETNSRLTGDGLNLEPSAQTGTLNMTIQGMPVGTHTIQTYHNCWSDSTTTTPYPISVSVNGSKVHENVARTSRVALAANATVLLTTFDVRSEGEIILLSFSTYDSIKPQNSKASVYLCPNLNGFEINTVSVLSFAKNPSPAQANMHVDADNGSVVLKWDPASASVARHYLYLGLDSVSVARADTLTNDIFIGSKPLSDTTHLVQGMYNLNTYFWRVDEKDQNGNTTKGKIWSFRPRHLAFRGAEGYGRFATGGRGGKVVEVTNLNDNGPGSLREAITNDIGPRTIVFKVSGLITLNSRLTLNDRYVTIAGQTAPGKGICIRKAPLGLGSESITRFIRVRVGAGITYDGMGMAGNDHTIADHCSVSWSIDEAFSSRNAKNITLQRTLISEALNVAGHDKYPAGKAHGFAGTISGDTGSFHHNLLAHCQGRNWSLGGGLDGNGYYSGRMDIRNTVVYNWGSRTTDGGTNECNFVNNYYKPGFETDNFYALTAQHEAVGKGMQRYYFSGNVMPGHFDESTQTKGRNMQGTVTYETYVDSAFFEPYVTTQTAYESYKNVLSDVGCTMPMIDDHDKRVIQETLKGTYTYKGSVTGIPGRPDNENDVGGWEHYPAMTRPDSYDTDHDGLPDWWETLHGSNVHSPASDYSDSNADPDKDGYTALEDYLEWMAVPHFYVARNATTNLDLSGLTVGYANPTLSVKKATKVNAAVAGTKLDVTPTVSSDGVDFVEVRIQDSEGAWIDRLIGVCISSTGQNLEQDGLSVLPNVGTDDNAIKTCYHPATCRLSIQSAQPVVSASVYDLVGKRMQHSSGECLSELNLTNLPKGVFVVRMATSDTKTYAVKILKK